MRYIEPPRRCKTPRCPNLHHNRNGYCDECNARRSASWRARRIAVAGTPMERRDNPPPGRRPSAHERGYTNEWTLFAKKFLARHPKCAICGKPAQVVDHKYRPAAIMLDMDGKFSTDPAEYQALCYSCNRRKAKEDAEKTREYFRMKGEINGG